jgi:peptidoglycan glycosyltransferase
MKELRRNIFIILAVFVAGFLFLIGYFSYAVYFYGGRWFENSYNVRIQSEKKKVITGSIYDRNGELLAVTDHDKSGELFRYYPKGAAAVHVVGYDHPKYGRAGAEAFFARYLLGFDNNIIERIYQTLFLYERKGNNVVLTIDSRLQRDVHQLLTKKKYQGAVVVMNAKTGELLTMVSRPDFNPNELEQVFSDVSKKEKENRTDGRFLNRATQGYYTPGSVFKIITAASALRYIEDVQGEIYDCDGKLDVNGQVIRDYNKETHGKISLKQAFSLSCNTTFAELGVDLGRTRLKKTAEDFGFNEEFLFNDVRMGKSKFDPVADAGEDELAWGAIGQGEDIVTPLHMAMIAGSIVNDGIMMEPKLLKGVVNIRGYEVKTIKPNSYKRTVSQEIASTLQDMMEEVVKTGTGKSLKPQRYANLKELSIGGKTGTAEVGEGKKKKNYAWYVGFADNGEDPLAIAIVLENVKGTGGKEAAPLAGEILNKAVGYLKKDGK